MGKKCDLDKFYTKKNVAEFCYASLKNSFSLEEYDLFIEPSAGSGNFLELLPKNKRLGFDLLPENREVVEKNWFDFDVPTHFQKVIIVGNPPFGERNKLSKEFIKHALKYKNVFTIAFVLPDVFKKYTNQTMLPKNWAIKEIISLPRNSFLLNGEDYHVPCSFFIFTKEPVEKDLRFDVEKYKSHKDFDFVKKESADFFVLGASLSTVKKIEDVNKNNRGYYIKSNIDKDKLIERFKSANWKRYQNSSANGGVAWFSKMELIRAYSLEFNEKGD